MLRIPAFSVKAVVVILFLFSSAAAYSNCSKTIVVNQTNWRPYMYINDKGEMAGLDHELVKAILETAQCNYEFVQMPSKRALLELENGRIDMVAGASITPAREKYGRFTASYRDETMVLFIRRDQSGYFPAKDLDQLLNSYQLIMGAVIGAYYGAEYEALNHKQLSQRNQLVLLKDNHALLPLLLNYRVDLVVGDRVSLSFIANEMGIGGQVSVHDHVLNRDLVHFLLSRKSTTAEDVESINQAIKSFRSSASYKLIMSHYGLEDHPDKEEIQESANFL
ncbi:ABC transporter substrate-binding protein [Hahella sp. CCB-MM4]|uniref:substrate-binding periplasmic protein n=1 Tax=Hahella sp. (strain CCB-MM4) TaxID=1926491 RepID=UPI001FED8300|nr:transporter substrate-binding domain-containing protein [Hahella sp. CCB-MM4]